MESSTIFAAQVNWEGVYRNLGINIVILIIAWLVLAGLSVFFWHLLWQRWGKAARIIGVVIWTLFVAIVFGFALFNAIDVADDIVRFRTDYDYHLWPWVASVASAIITVDIISLWCLFYKKVKMRIVRVMGWVAVVVISGLFLTAAVSMAAREAERIKNIRLTEQKCDELIREWEAKRGETERLEYYNQFPDECFKPLY